MTSLIVGNWKMNGLRDSRKEVAAMAASLAGDPAPAAEVVVCPPAMIMAELASMAEGTGLQVGAQDCHSDPAGAHTGDISAEMIADAGGTYVIVGHSERRTDHGEGDAVVKAKAEAALRAGLTPIVCVGESAAIREAGAAVPTVTLQVKQSLPEDLSSVVVAYEPIWAIGTGNVATPKDVEEMHAAIRQVVGDTMPILYGGSVKPSNAAEILAVPNVGGALVGGASLRAEDFLGIIRAA